MDNKAFDELVGSLKQAGEISRGVAVEGSRFTLFFDSSEIKEIRKSLGMTQKAFSDRFGIPIETIRHWEQGDRTPDRAAMAFLNALRAEPAAVLRAFG